MKVNYKSIYERTKQMVIKPQMIWPEVLEEDLTVKEIFRSYLLPVAIITSVFVLLFSFINYTAWQAIGLAFINLISAVAGTWLAYLITREYLCGKLNYQDNQALNLTVYSSAVFILFHGLGSALGNIFIGQLFTLLSFIFIHTLYVGIGILPNVSNGQKTNILVIVSLAITCIPIIISQIFMIVFRISAIQV